MYAVRPNLHAVLGPGRYTHLNVEKLRARLQAGFCAAHFTQFVVGTGLDWLFLVSSSFFAGEVEYQMGPDMLFEQAGPNLIHWWLTISSLRRHGVV